MSNPTMTFMIRFYPDIIFFGRLNSASQSHFKFYFLAIFSAFALLISSCEEEPLKIGSEILPESDFVNIKSTDTISVFSYTVYDESIRTENQTYSFLGSINDPYFGLTTADFVTQLRLGEEWVKGDYVIDSVKLNLVFLNARGSSNGTNHLRISEIAEMLYLDSTYLSNKQIPLTGYSIPDLLLPRLKIDTINYVELDLPVAFGQHLIRDSSMLFHDNSKPDFRSFFKGLNFQVITSGEPIFLTLSLAPPEGGYSNFFTLFMTSGDVHKEYFFILDARSNNARFNRFTHNFNAASSEQKIQHINDGIKDTLSYSQGLNGVYTRVFLPGLEDIKSNPDMANIAVNKARLVVPLYIDGETYNGSRLATQLLVRYRTATGSKFYVPDYDPNNLDFFDGKVDTTAQVCSFNVASFVQGYLEDKSGLINPELEIFITPADTRNIILKANDSSTPVRFEFTYTKF